MREENDRLERRGSIIEHFYLKVFWFSSVNSSPFNNVKINMRTKFEGGVYHFSFCNQQLFDKPEAMSRSKGSLASELSLKSHGP